MEWFTLRPMRLLAPDHRMPGASSLNAHNVYSDPDEAVRRWLQEVARRGARGAIGPRRIPEERRLGVRRDVGLVLLGVLIATYLQYYFFDVLLQTVSMHSIIVFVLASAH